MTTTPGTAIAVERPAARAQVAHRSAAGHAPETFCTSGTSPTVHLIGVGPVGRALLHLCADAGYRVVGISDSSATVHDRNGLDVRRIAAFKAAGGALIDRPGGEGLPVALAVDLVAADVVVDAAATDLDGVRDAVDRGRVALYRVGAAGGLVLASKAGLCAAVGDWLGGERRARVGFNAVLGGTGASLLAQLDELRERATAVAFAGNASTTTILTAIERGGSLADGIEEARRCGFLERDVELDLRGTDAAIKLAIVAGALAGAGVDPREIACEDLRAIDPATVRERARRGATTRLVARWTRAEGAPHVRYEEVARTDPLAVPSDRVAYTYRLDDGRLRVHTAAGVGAENARAAWSDLVRLASRIGCAQSGGAR